MDESPKGLVLQLLIFFLFFAKDQRAKLLLRVAPDEFNALLVAVFPSR